MKLKDLLYNMTEFAIHNTLVNYAMSDTSLFSINAETIVNYPLLFLQPVNWSNVEENTTSYQISIYYIDRLLEDNSNNLDIDSTGVEVLKNYINGLEALDGVQEVDKAYRIRYFTETEKLNDRCAGAYCTITITTLNDSVCYDE